VYEINSEAIKSLVLDKNWYIGINKKSYVTDLICQRKAVFVDHQLFNGINKIQKSEQRKEK